MWKGPANQSLLESLDIPCATVWEASDLLKALAILTDATVTRFVVDQEYLKDWPEDHIGNLKKVTFLEAIKKPTSKVFKHWPQKED